MCDIYSLGSAAGDFINGRANAIEARSQADFEVAQLESVKILTAARRSDTEGEMRRAYSDHMRQNLAAIAISGLAVESFDSVQEGNVKDMQRNLRKVSKDADLETMNLTLQQMEARIEGKRRAKAAKYAGINSALSTLHDAERSYQEYNTGESRWQSVMKSVRGGR